METGEKSMNDTNGFESTTLEDFLQIDTKSTSGVPLETVIDPPVSTDDEPGDDAGEGEGTGDNESKAGEGDPSATGESNGSEKPKPAATGDQTALRSALKDLIGDDSIIQVIDGEEVEVPLDELDLNYETFLDTVKGYVEQQKEAVAANRISAEGISEFTKDLIEIEKKGGSIRELLEERQKTVGTLDQIDTTTREGQRAVIYVKMKHDNPKLTDASIIKLLNAYEAEGVLEQEAMTSETEMREDFAAKVEKEKEQATKDAEDRKQFLKGYKKSVTENLSTAFTLKDPIKKKLVDALTPNDKGEYEINKAYAEARKDPARAAKLALFLLDEEEYNLQVSSSKVKAHQLNTAGKIKIVKSTEAAASMSNNKSKPGNSEVSLDEFLTK